MQPTDNTINYVELPLVDRDATQTFFGAVFGWKFQDWGPSYLGFSGAGLDGGFNVELKPSELGKGPLVILFADDLDSKLEQVKKAGGKVTQEIFEFPGGRRFHFTDPNNNELAVWGMPLENRGR